MMSSAHSYPGSTPAEAVTQWGIGVKLLGAFALVAALAILASGVALHSYQAIGQDIGQIRDESLPGTTHALTLARQASGLAAASSLLSASASTTDLDKAVASVNQRRAAMEDSLKGLAAIRVNQASAAKLRDMVNGLGESTRLLAVSVGKKLAIAQERARLLEDSLAAHRAILA
jgi:phosphoglycerate-specific signal transduction histidine kinase